jgi:hypothetical protein
MPLLHAIHRAIYHRSTFHVAAPLSDIYLGRGFLHVIHSLLLHTNILFHSHVPQGDSWQSDACCGCAWILSTHYFADMGLVHVTSPPAFHLADLAFASSAIARLFSAERVSVCLSPRMCLLFSTTVFNIIAGPTSFPCL